MRIVRVHYRGPAPAGAPHRGEDGSALMAVIVVMAVMMVITAMVTGVSFYSLGLTSATRAGVQSIAAAESGVNVAEVSLKKGACQPQYTRTTPAFTASVSYSLSAAGENWVAGCPGGGVAALRVRVLSTGTAMSVGVAGNTDGDASTVEAVFSYIPGVAPAIKPTGAGMYLYGGVVFRNNANLLVAESGRAAIQVKNGSVECQNNTVIEGDVVVPKGALKISKCSIEGNAWASGAATLGKVTGNLTALSVNLAGSALRKAVGGVYTKYTSSASLPAIPGWYDLGYAPGDWVDAGGVPYKVTPVGTNCTIDAALIAAAANGSKPVIIDSLTVCPLGVRASGTVRLTNDLVIFAHRFTYNNNVTFRSSTSAQHRLWFITPDTVANGLPTCAPFQGNFAMNNGFTIDDTLHAMLYTPCRLEANNTFDWRGQLYANGENDFKNSTSFEYVPLGLPGVNLDTGLPTGGTVGTVGRMGDLSSLRDISDAG